MDVREQYAYLKPQPFVWLAVLGSGALHLGLVALVVIGGILEEGYKPLKDQAIITRLVKKGKKKDPGTLPVKAAKPKPPPAPKAVTKPSEAKPVDAKADPTPRKKPSRSSKVDYSKDMSTALNALADPDKTDYEQEGDPDGVEDGEALIKQKGDVYLTSVYKAVKSKYELPELISSKERMFLRAVVILKLDARGQIKAIEWEKRSGNRLYDSAVEGAIRRAAPFPAPPTELVDRYSRHGIGIPFAASRM